MTSTQTKPTVRGGKPDALDDPIKMALAAPLLRAGIELAAAQMRDKGEGGLYLDLAVQSARRFVAQSVDIAGQAEQIGPLS